MSSMSDEIVFLPVDTCNHYVNRIHEISDEVTSIRNTLAVARQIAEENWSGESGQASLDVINKFNDKFREIDNSLSEAMILITGMSLAEE